VTWRRVCGYKLAAIVRIQAVHCRADAGSYAGSYAGL